MDESTEYGRAVTPLVEEMRERLLLARIEIGKSGSGPHADYELAALERLRRTLAAVELRLETVESARLAGRDEGFRNGLRVGRKAAARPSSNVVVLRQPRAVGA